MAEYVGLHDNGKSSVQGFMDIFSGLYGAGVANISNTNAWIVAQRGAGANMSVDIAAGRGLLADTLIHYPAWSDATVNMAITTAHATLARRDIVVAYFDETVPSTATTNNQGALKFLVVAGTPAASPADPTDPTIQTAVGAGNPWIKLARVSVAAAASSIVNGNITDLRTTIAVRGKVNTEAIADQGVTTAKIADSNVTTSKIADGNVTGVKMEARPVDYLANFIASGGVVAQSAGLVGTFSNMVHYINGVRCTKTSVANKTYTASKDTYVDADATNNATVVYTEVANGAASPALTAGYIRVAKVVTNGSAITSVSQWGLDSLGNRIYPNNGYLGKNGAWQAATLQNSWVNFGSGFATAAYMRDAVGVVHIKGVIKNGTTTATTVLFTLPVGYRPAENMIFNTSKSLSSYTDMRVLSTGSVQLGDTGGSASYTSLDGISFLAEQ